MSVRRGLGVIAAAMAVLCGCGQSATQVSMPQHILPPVYHGLTVIEDGSAPPAFHVDSTLASDGRLWVFQSSGVIYGALQVATLKPSVDASDIDQQQNIRSQIGSSGFSYYIVNSQWVAEQDTQDEHLFVWFPHNGADGVFEVLTLTTDFPDQRSFLSGLLTYQEKGA